MTGYVVAARRASTPEWLSAALGRAVRGVQAEAVGTGQIGACYRLHLDGDDVPATLLAKLPSAEPGARDLMAGAYRGEVRFYTDIAPTVAIRVPLVAYAAVADEGGGFTLLLEDLAPASRATSSPAAASRRPATRWSTWPGSTRRAGATRP